jgi:Flp pilus assembly pilin Flp
MADNAINQETRGAIFNPNKQYSGLGVKRILKIMGRLWRDEQGQDIAEYAVMLAVILIIVVGTIKLIGTNTNSTFSSVASAVQ